MKKAETETQKPLRRKAEGVKQQLLTNKDFCDRLGMSYEWGRKRIQRRQIAFVQIGRSIRIPEEEVDRFIADNFVPATKAR
jgi:excisionase family DNA binding protein